MAGKAGSTIVGVVTITLMTLNVLFWCSPLFVVALAKFLLPLAGWRRLMSRVLIFIAERWIYTNNLIFRLTGTLRIDARGLDGLKREEWYLVVSNHRSWVDILVLQAALTGRVPFLKFFLKQQLIWVPVLGLAWWALDFPFMRRHSAAYLAKHPQMRGKDLEATRRAWSRCRCPGLPPGWRIYPLTRLRQGQTGCRLQLRFRRRCQDDRHDREVRCGLRSQRQILRPHEHAGMV